METLFQPQVYSKPVSPSLDPIIVPKRDNRQPKAEVASNRVVNRTIVHNRKASFENPEYLPYNGTKFTVTLIGRSRIEDSRSGKYTVYCIETNQTAPYIHKWSVRRRYRHFVDFRTKLRRCGARNLSALPPKTWTSSNFDENFLRKRQEGLNSWLQAIPHFFCRTTIDATFEDYRDVLSVIRSFLIDLENDEYGYKSQVSNTTDIVRTNSNLLKGDMFNDDDAMKSNGLVPTICRSSSSPQTTPKSPHSLRHSTPIAAVNISNFELLKVLGKGSYGKVILVRKKSGHDAGTLYAMKVLKKEHVMKKKQIAHTQTERSVLGSIRHPFIVRLHYAFQTGEKLHFVLDYCSGGELFFHLQKHGRFPPKLALFYTAELSLALGELHKHGVVYRDMKPENILLDDVGHVQLADFGLSKEGITSGEKGTRSFCGTPEYLAPEVLERKGHGFAVDWWALGALLYEMITGLPPWYSRDRQKMFACIRGAPLQFPGYVVGELKALIASFLIREPTNRLGGRGKDVVEIKEHPIFRNVNWNALVRRETKPPWKPPVKSMPTTMKCSYDTSNFEQTFTNLPVQSVGSSVNDNLGRAVRGDSATNGAFEGFTYVDESVLMEENFQDRLDLGAQQRIKNLGEHG
eukprot:g15522.t1